MDFDCSIKISNEIVSQEVGEELMLLNLATEEFFGLDVVAGDIWRQLQEGKSMQEALDTLLRMYDVSEVQLRADIERFVHELVDKQLVEIVP